MASQFTSNFLSNLSFFRDPSGARNFFKEPDIALHGDVMNVTQSYDATLWIDLKFRGGYDLTAVTY